MDPVLISAFVSFFLSCYVCMTGSHPEKNNSSRGLWRTGAHKVVWTAKSSSFARRYSRAEASTLLMANMKQNFKQVMGHLDKLENKVMYVVEKKV